MRPLIALLPMLLLVAGCDRQSADAPQPAPTAQAKAPESGKVDTTHKGALAPADAFLDPAGKSVTLAAFEGRPVLVNLWATWCGPCVKEMPTLDAIAVEAGDRLKVLTVSQDRAGVAIAPTFAKGGFKRLEQYRDPGNSLGFAIGGGNLPTTVLFDAEGREVWRVTGAMDWSGPVAKTLLADVLG